MWISLVGDNSQRIETIIATKKWAPLIYIVFGQAGWFACVLSAARGAPWIGTTLVLVLIAAHLRRVARPLEEFKLLMSVVVIGSVWESLLVFFGLLYYPSGIVIPGLAPFWIPALWALFAAQVNTSYGWLKKRILMAPLLGAIAGPLSFRAGVALGALRFLRPVSAIIALSLGWAVLLTTTIILSRRWDGVRPEP